jgi:hypothetical protein
VNYDLLRKLGNYGLIANTIFGQFVNLQMSLVVSAVLGLISIPYYAKTKVPDGFPSFTPVPEPTYNTITDTSLHGRPRTPHHWHPHG